MPDHFHGILFVRGFKAGCTMAWRGQGGSAPQWAEGFVDTILFHRGQLARMVAYVRDNPLRLGVKREHPDLFKVLRDVEMPFAGGTAWDGPAVLVSPCISDGEREIARRAFEAGLSVISLRNKGFSPLYKPGGRLFETCADGNLLLLAPVNWPHQPAEKPMTRKDAQVLNRIAQLLCGDGAAEIDYHGAVLRDVDAAVAAAVGSAQ